MNVAVEEQRLASFSLQEARLSYGTFGLTRQPAELDIVFVTYDIVAVTDVSPCSRFCITSSFV